MTILWNSDHIALVDGQNVIGAGLAAGVYSGLTYGLTEARGVHDWVLPFTSIESCTTLYVPFYAFSQ